MSESLKPCCFCGSDKVDLTDVAGQSTVMCFSESGCQAHGPLADTDDAAVKAWNSRSNKAVKDEAKRPEDNLRTSFETLPRC